MLDPEDDEPEVKLFMLLPPEDDPDEKPPELSALPNPLTIAASNAAITIISTTST